jgi:hypothetical protein
VGAPSKSAYVAKAEAACTATNAPLAATAKPGSYAALATAAGTFSTAADGQLARLRQLKRPGGGARSDAAAALGALDATAQSTHRLQLAASGGDDATVAAAARDLSTTASSAGITAKAFGFSACGSGIAQGTGALTAGAKDLVKAAAVTRGNTACRTFGHDLAAIPKPHSPKDLSAFVARWYDTTHKMLADLKALPVAPGDEAAFASLTAIIDTEDAAVGELRDAMLAGNSARVDALTKPTDTDKAFEIQLDGYGLTTCGTDFKTS